MRERYGREGEHVEPLGYGYGKQQESDYVERYGLPDQAEIFLIDGPKTGRGPRNCEEHRGGLFDDVCVRLTQHGAVDACGIEIKIEETVVVLNGIVPSQEEKRLAEEVARSIQGVSRVENRLEVP